MAKQQRSFKQTAVAKQGEAGHQLEQTEMFDDNLLPDASEIERLQAMDPDIMIWLKERAAKEQDFRHDAHYKKLAFIDKTEKRNHGINMLGLTFAFIFLVGGLGCSVYLLLNNCIITGSIFIGFSLILGASILSGRKVVNNNPSKLPTKPNQN